MARDLTIYGINRAEFLNRLQEQALEWSFSEAELVQFMTKFDHDLPITGVVALEDFLWERKGISTEELHQQMGFQKIATLRSKQICLAIAQFIDHYALQLSARQPEQHALELHQGSFITNKAKLLDVLDWLIAVGSAMQGGTDAQMEIHFPNDLEIAANELVQNGFCASDEFEFFPDHLPMLIDWRQDVDRTAFDCYYWEDSF